MVTSTARRRSGIHDGIENVISSAHEDRSCTLFGDFLSSSNHDIATTSHFLQCLPYSTSSHNNPCHDLLTIASCHSRSRLRASHLHRRSSDTCNSRKRDIWRQYCGGFKIQFWRAVTLLGQDGGGGYGLLVEFAEVGSGEREQSRHGRCPGVCSNSLLYKFSLFIHQEPRKGISVEKDKKGRMHNEA